MQIDMTASVVRDSGIEVRVAKVAQILAEALGSDWGRARAFRTDDSGALVRVEHDGSTHPTLDASACNALRTAIRGTPAWQREVCTAIDGIFGARIVSTLGGPLKQASMQREATYLSSLAATGQTLTDEQRADAAILTAINIWETAMVEKREELLAAADLAAAQTDTAWPPAPAGVTAEWLAGY